MRPGTVLHSIDYIAIVAIYDFTRVVALQAGVFAALRCGKPGLGPVSRNGEVIENENNVSNAGTMA